MVRPSMTNFPDIATVFVHFSFRQNEVSSRPSGCKNTLAGLWAANIYDQPGGLVDITFCLKARQNL